MANLVRLRSGGKRNYCFSLLFERVILAFALVIAAGLIASEGRCADDRVAPVKPIGTDLLKQYASSIQQSIRRNWTPIPSASSHRCTVRFRVHKDGRVTGVTAVDSGASAANEQRAREAVEKCAPFPPLPKNSPEFIDAEFSFEFDKYPPLGLTVKQAINSYGPAARKLLRTEFTSVNESYPPEKLALIAFKKERVLCLYTDGKAPKLVKSFPLVSFSGVLGPKLKEGDLQIPEGLYHITNQQAHTRLALGVDYPNALDRQRAALEHRTNLGGNILVHGGVFSTGCLVVSNEDMKQIFTAVYDVGCHRTKLLIAPCDLRIEKPDLDMKKQPKWLPALYKDLGRQLKKYS